ncbi:hypothetical protein [uncultured Tateyamaria sp.]|uniref:hypothetical protein n=1 Tax=Tateyamaria sp. 1078 TaxID=3417464 RepID=UPI002621D701|nr:hypothetical protein [uncultured Tateyamaria sp.]
MLARVEAVILRHDPGAGETKGRAYPASVFHHTHLKVTVSLLSKPHRGAAFVAALQDALRTDLGRDLPRPCWLSIDITFSTPNYHTELLT